MRLSLAIVTRNSSQYIETLLKVGRGLADEVVVAVDASCSDATEEICEKYADKLFKFAPIPNPERPLGWLNRQCSGDWILRLDDDELPSAGLVRKLPELLRDRDMTHYWLRRRWVVGRNSQSWIHQRPWWPDWQLRLFRNIPSIVHVPGTLHSSYVVQGACRNLTDGSLYHFDLVYHSREERQQKVARYRQVAGEASHAEYYLIPDELPPALRAGAAVAGQSPSPPGGLPTGEAITLLPFPSDDPPARAPSPRGIAGSRGERPFARLLGRSRFIKGNATELVTNEDLLLTNLQNVQRGPGLFQAALRCIDCPARMRAGEQYPVDLDLSNESAVKWARVGAGTPDVLVSYHWLRSSAETHTYEGLRTSLPHTLGPGEQTRVVTQVLAPREPGTYLLQWDLLIEGYAWFSTQGWEGPRVEITVES